jgi:aspartate/methionine/tyrosine aminotransferase
LKRGLGGRPPAAAPGRFAALALLNDTGVVTIGGPDSGILDEGYLRLSCANSTENILKALDRMGNFLATRKAA